jgi:ATP-dependent DNA helicase RecG
VVCPVRERATRAGAITAVRRAAELRRELGPAGVRVGLLHGDLDAADKDALLRRFAGGDVDVLVATTVVELGLDVPNAAVILIEEADRFGLSQLHQLRGRVGRGAFAGLCLLCPAAGIAVDSDAARRLAELVASQDGFRIAEADLALRGPGDLYGERQAGAQRLRWGALADQIDLLEQARGEAGRIAAADPTLDLAAHRALRAAVDRRWAARAVFAEESG